MHTNTMFNLAHCLNNDYNDSPYSHDHFCPYIDSEQFYSKLGPNKMSIVSMNVRSIINKWNDICNFLGNSNFQIDFLTVQEIWNIPPNYDTTIDGYHPLVFKTRDNSGLSANIGGGSGDIY